MIRRPTPAVHSGDLAMKTKCHSIAEWDFSLWFTLQGSLAGVAAVSPGLREFANNSRIFKAFALTETALPQFFSFAGSVARRQRSAQSSKRTKPVLSQRGTARSRLGVIARYCGRVLEFRWHTIS
jgi:hypothetical protein